MSTKFPTLPTPVPLTVLLESATRAVLSRLTQDLRATGHPDVAEPHLILFGNLDCGTTHAAAISRSLRDMQTMGYLTLSDDPDRGNQKRVTMTPAGMALATAARAALAAIERDLSDQLGPQAVGNLCDMLAACAALSRPPPWSGP
jgi:hypothetical protein